MMEPQHREAPLNGGPPYGAAAATAAAAVASTSEPTAVGSKRQRRPSVRLGDIGGDYVQGYEPNVRRSKKEGSQSGRASKTRTLVTLGPDYGSIGESLGNEKEGNLGGFDPVGIGGWRAKRRGCSGATTKRVRSNWPLKVEPTKIFSDVDNEEDDEDEKYRDFEEENSESPIDSPLGGTRVDEREAPCANNNKFRRSRAGAVGFCDNRDVELSGPSDLDGRDGVRIWLDGLGLGRYWPVFKIHEVDDEVLPLLTLEDLKDMGITAVGSRRKMFCAIQKLGKEFS